MKYAEILDKLHENGNFRKIPDISISNNIVDLSSNDYLGIADDNQLRHEFMLEALQNGYGMTSSASRLLAGAQDEYYKLEQTLSSLYNREVLLFNSGYHCNVGLISALATGKTLIVADKLVHASIIDGIMLSKCDFTRFRHNDYEHLDSIMAKRATDYERVLIVTESVYSMDGDYCDVDRLVEIKRRYDNALLYIDEAHAFGVLGDKGLGLVNNSASKDGVDVIIGTFGKAAASSGAFCATSREIKDIAINCSRSFIFSTAIAPINVAWTRHVVNKIVGMDSCREKLQQLAHQLHATLSQLSSVAITPSHIQPLVVGDSRKAVELSHRLLEAGFKVLPIRTPTVPPGTERLRFSLSASLTSAQIGNLCDELRKL
jgi:8-amino-7-oxononanoate synthase